MMLFFMSRLAGFIAYVVLRNCSIPNIIGITQQSSHLPTARKYSPQYSLDTHILARNTLMFSTTPKYFPLNTHILATQQYIQFQC